jgi:hypothetical protein
MEMASSMVKKIRMLAVVSIVVKVRQTHARMMSRHPLRA